jgi:membrane protein
VLDNLSTLAPGPANDIVTGAIHQIAASQGTAGIVFAIGLIVAIWSASGYVGAFTRASNAIYEIGEGRPFWKLRPWQILITLALIILLAVSSIAVVVTGPLAEQVGKVFGLQSTTVTIWDIAKWPAIVLIVMTAIAILYYAAPNVSQPGFRWITPGGVVAVIVWILASLAFALYVANFASYNKTYGSLAGAVVFLVWLWISNLAILLGAEMNAELERGRELRVGIPEDRTLAMEPRADPGSG